MLEEHLLDRHRVDVVAAADDQVLGPAGDPQVAVRVEPAEVAGVDPARLDEGAAVVRVAQVAGEHAGAVHRDDADLVDRAVAEKRPSPSTWTTRTRLYGSAWPTEPRRTGRSR